MLRIGSFNVENLFARSKALNDPDWSKQRDVLSAQAEFNTLIGKDVYGVADKARMLELLKVLAILTTDESPLVFLRKMRGSFLRRPFIKGTRKVDADAVVVVANGRTDWIGWVELKTEPVKATAMTHTAMVMRDVNADILGVVEAESRPLLNAFSAAMLKEVGAVPYAQVMLVDGNDDRGIDVGILVRAPYTLSKIRSHVFDKDKIGAIFSRDCIEYWIDLDGKQLVVLVNHLKSKGYGSDDDPIGAKRRTRQAKRVRTIYDGLIADGVEYVAIIGDFNDSPDSEALKPLLKGSGLVDISSHPKFKFGERAGTFQGGGAKDKIDYILCSPALFKKAKGGAVFRDGVWHGPRVKAPWKMYETMKTQTDAASDHAAIFGDFDI
jgi:endonuclease/exonuclease/phosphatase family metal-dependent hydrolase